MDKFYKIDDKLLKLKMLKDKNGKECSISANHKIVYLYLKDRFDFFTSNKQDYFDTNKTIAENTGLEERTVIRCIKMWIDLGYVEKKVVKYKNLPKNIFTKVSPIIFETKSNKLGATNKEIVKPVINVDSFIQNNYDFDYDDSEIPF